MTDAQILELGFEALVDKLGPTGMIRFIHQFETGTGNYTKDRHQWLEVSDVRTLANQIQQAENSVEVKIGALSPMTEKEPDAVDTYSLYASDPSNLSEWEKTGDDLTAEGTEMSVIPFHIEGQIQTFEL
jgi:hypothetical protein